MTPEQKRATAIFLRYQLFALYDQGIEEATVEDLVGGWDLDPEEAKSLEETLKAAIRDLEA